MDRRLGKYNIFNHNIVFQFPTHQYMNRNHLVHYINYFVVEVMMDLMPLMTSPPEVHNGDVFWSYEN